VRVRATNRNLAHRPHGLGQKSPIPRRFPYVTGITAQARQLSPARPREFAKVHNVDIPGIVRRLNTKPVIRVEAGVFVGYLEQRQYRLGPIGEGILLAVRRMVRLCAEDRGNKQVAS